MSHTWHKVPYAAKRRSRIPMHPASVWMMGPSCIYGRTSRRQGEESRRERWKSNYFFFFFFFFFPLSRCLPSCVRQIRAGGGKKIEAHSPSTRNQLGSLGVRISDLCPRSVSAPQYSLIHPRPLSLRGGDIGLIL